MTLVVFQYVAQLSLPSAEMRACHRAAHAPLTSTMQRGLSMYVYSGFWHVVGRDLERRYTELMSQWPDDGAIYTGPDRFLFHPVVGLAAQFRHARRPSHASLYLLPVSPMYLCAAQQSVSNHGRGKPAVKVEDMMNSVRFATRYHMSQAHAGVAPQGLFCSSYLALLAWVGNHSHFDATTTQHVWHFSHSFYLTSAIWRDDNRTVGGLPVAAVNSAGDPYRVMRPGIFLTQEHRAGLPPPNVVLIPFYSPPYFLFRGDGSDPPRRTLLTSSSHHSTACHRFDSYPSGGGRRWSCAEQAVANSGRYRKTLELMSTDLNATLLLRQPDAVPPCPRALCGQCTSVSCPPTALQYKVLSEDTYGTAQHTTTPTHPHAQ